jgi:hypothetical protein
VKCATCRAGAERHRAKPVGPAGEVSCAGSRTRLSDPCENEGTPRCLVGVAAWWLYPESGQCYSVSLRGIRDCALAEVTSAKTQSRRPQGCGGRV